jgi:hypothetical protein
VRYEREISNAGRSKLDFAERDECKPVPLGLSLDGNLAKPLFSLYGTEWRERGYGLWNDQPHFQKGPYLAGVKLYSNFFLMLCGGSFCFIFSSKARQKSW